MLLALLSSGARAAETPIPPAPSRWLTDTAGFLSAQTRASLDARLQAYEASTKHQVIVYIGDTTGGVPIEDWAVRAVRKDPNVQVCLVHACSGTAFRKMLAAASARDATRKCGCFRRASR